MIIRLQSDGATTLTIEAARFERTGTSLRIYEGLSQITPILIAGAAAKRDAHLRKGGEDAMLDTKMRPANIDIVRPRVPHGPLAIAPKTEGRAVADRTPVRLLRISEVCALVGISRAMVYKCMAQETLPFPKPVKIGAASRWAFEDVKAWVAALRDARERSA